MLSVKLSKDAYRVTEKAICIEGGVGIFGHFVDQFFGYGVFCGFWVFPF